MKTLQKFLILIALLIFSAPSSANTTNDENTKLLSQPSISDKHIAFIYAEDLWIANLDGSNPIRLTIDEGVESNPIFSPDGTTIAFNAEYDGNIDVG